jgi:hypothetical protein
MQKCKEKKRKDQKKIQKSIKQITTIIQPHKTSAPVEERLLEEIRVRAYTTRQHVEG